MSLTRVSCALVLVCGLFASARAESATLTVNAGGDLQAAINAAKPGDMILTLGAGSISQLGAQLVEALETRSAKSVG